MLSAECSADVVSPLRLTRDGKLPVLAVGQPVPDGCATATLRVQRDGEEIVLLTQDLMSVQGRGTVIYEELDVGDSAIALGETATLLVRLSDGDGRAAASLCHPVRMTKFAP